MHVSFSEVSDSNARRIETKSCFHVVNPCVMVVMASKGGGHLCSGLSALLGPV